jgi:hypothetical protein
MEAKDRLIENLWLAMIALSTTFAVYFYEVSGWAGVCAAVFWIALIVGVVWAVFHAFDPQRIHEQGANKAARDAAIVCSLCHKRGFVRTEATTVKQGIDGTKLAFAFLTSGLSILAMGLSQRNSATRATCGNCGQSWHF